MIRLSALPFLLPLLLLSCNLFAQEKPNVLILFTDDQGTLDVNCYGATDLHTPNLDKLAETGVRFTQAYAHTVCCPSRAALLTGRHPNRGGVQNWLQGDRNGTDTHLSNMFSSEVTMAEVFKKAGYKTAVISGGFQYVGDVLQRQLGIDYVFANKLKHVDGVMTGEVEGDIVDAQRKAELLRVIAQSEDIALQQTIAIGDGANDLPMLVQSGLGVAFHAKPVVRESAHHAISTFGLDAVLYLIGFSDRDIDQALASED